MYNGEREKETVDEPSVSYILHYKCTSRRCGRFTGSYRVLSSHLILRAWPALASETAVFAP